MEDKMERAFKKIAQIFFCAFICTSSFDIIFNFQIHGFHIRIGMIFLGVSELLGLFYVIQEKKIVIPSGGGALIALLIINALFCFNSPGFFAAVGYELWFVMLVGAVFLACNIYKENHERKYLYQIFLLQFVIMASFGLLQFIVGLFDHPLLTMQWTKPFLPRLNGLCYEPSYYSSYLLIGWVTFAYLFERKDTSFFSSAFMKTSLIIISGAIIFSTSRMGWIMIVLWCTFRLVYTIIKDKAKISKILFLFGIIIVFLSIIVFLTNLKKPLVTYFADYDVEASTHAVSHAEEGFGERYVTDIIKLPQGSQIENLPEKSLLTTLYTNSRFIAMVLIFRVFLKSPFIGYSLGGVTSAVVESYPQITAQLEVKTACITVELLAAFGVFGFILVLIYFLILVKSVIKKYVLLNDNILAGLFFALIWELGILQFNQNVLRLYLWAVIAILSVSISSNSIFNLTTLKMDRKEI